MTKEFDPADFEPLYDQTLILTTSIASTTNDLSALLSDLTKIHTQLSSLITRATNPNSLLRKRCADRHPEWLQLSYDLQNTLCDAQDLLTSLEKPNYSHGINEDEEYTKLIKVSEELGTHAFLIGEWIDSLGLSKLARKDPALGEIERFLIDAAREEREKDPKGVENMPEINRLGGLFAVNLLLREKGVDAREIARLDTKIKSTLCWVFKNEEEITKVARLEGTVEEKKDSWSMSPMPSFPARQQPIIGQYDRSAVQSLATPDQPPFLEPVQESNVRASAEDTMDAELKALKTAYREALGIKKNRKPKNKKVKPEKISEQVSELPRMGTGEMGESPLYEEVQSKSQAGYKDKAKKLEDVGNISLSSSVPAKTEREHINLFAHPPVGQETSKAEDGKKIEGEQESEDGYMAVEKEPIDDEVDDFVWV